MMAGVKKNRPRMMYIYRLDDENGWNVQICRSSFQYNKFFSDNINGGRELALDAARKFRDDLVLGFDGARDRFMRDLKSIKLNFSDNLDVIFTDVVIDFEKDRDVIKIKN